MNQVMSCIVKEGKALVALKKETKKWLETAPEGSLGINSNKNRVEYYHMKPGGGKNGTYIKKNDEHLAMALAQKKYCQEVMALTDKKIEIIRNFLESYPVKGEKDLYEELEPIRKSLITPIIMTDEEYVRRWQMQEYEKKTFQCR